MEQTKKKIKQIYKSDYFPFLILAIGMMIFHIIIKFNYGDDLYFTKVLKENRLLIWTQERYATWTSRFIIEGILVTILKYNPIVWKIIDVAMMILLSTSISKIFVTTNLRKNNWMIVGFVFLYPFKDMSTAGWGTTTINYLWPLSIGIYCLLMVKKILNNNKIKWYEYVCSTGAVIFAANAEQMCAILLAVYGMGTLYLLLKRKFNIYMITQTCLCLISIVFILTCPGNEARKAAETITWFIDFNTLSFLNKLELGFSSSIAKFIFEPNIFFMMLCLLIFTVTMLKHKNRNLRIISAVPLVCSIFFGVFAYAISKIFTGFPNIVTSVTKYGTITKENFYLIQSYIPIVLLASIGIFFLVSLYFCFEDKNKGILVILIALLGLASRIAVGFSPTIWGSNDRTFIYMYFSLIICAVMVYNELTESEIVKLKWINKTIAISSLISFMFLIAYTFILQIFQNRENLMNFIKSIF